MPYSSSTTVASGSTANVSVPFQFLDRTHVHVRVDLADVPDNSLSWASDGVITLPTTPDSGAVVKVYRRTPLDGLVVTFSDPAVLSSKNLNRADRQLLYVLQENADDAAFAISVVNDIVDTFAQITALATQVSEDAAAAHDAAQALGNQAQTFDTLTDLATSTIQVGVNAVRVLGALAIGDGGDEILKVVSAPSIIKPWHKPSDGGWTQLMGTVGKIAFFGGRASGSTMNIAANNQALKDIAQWLAERKEAGCATDMAIHPGVYDYDDNLFNLAQHGATLRSLGQPILRYHGGDDAFILEGGTHLPDPPDGDPNEPGIYGFHMLGELTIQSNTSAGHAIILRGALDSDLNLRCGGGSSATKAGLLIEFGVCSRIRYSCSSNYRPPGSGGGGNWWSGGEAPYYGVLTQGVDGSPGTPPSSCTLSPVIEGVQRGAFLAAAGNMQIVHGTIEGCPVSGLTLLTGASAVVYGTDFESNGLDVECYSVDSTFMGINCSGQFGLSTTGGASASRNRIIGGNINKVLLDGGTHHNQVLTNFNTRGDGFLIDNGDHNMTRGSFDATNQEYFIRGITAISVGATPFDFVNTSGDTIAVSVAGGTVSALSVEPNGGGTFIPTGLTAGIFILAPKDVLRVAHTGAPTMKFWGV